MSKKVILFSRDPGGTNTVAPLYEKLIEKGYCVKLYGKDVALNKYSQYGLNGIDINKKLNRIAQMDLYEFLLKESPDFLITGTSADDFTEKYLWECAKKLGIASFAILDQWVNYGVRFSKFSVNELKEYEKKKEHIFLPSKILVMDNYAKEQMVKEGIHEDKILVSGHPYFDYLIKKKEAIDEKVVKNFRESIGIKEDYYIITYASEPISKTYNENDNSEHFWGYTERTIFKEFIDVLNQVAPKCRKKIKLIIRLHPKENENNYNDLIDNIHNNISVLIDKKLDGFKLMCASNLICGMSSMFLIESAILEKSIISIQIGLSRKNPFILDKIGIVKSILEKKELEEIIQRVILEDEIEKCKFQIQRGAINNIIRFMEEVI
ncbi:CDP-glycerol glycerophosphotransferase family protein [Clostridium diolis]|uniref:CDP-glycerol glycerophosphotransferase family protein n=1 Tax=Clostridium diolis TaxID=223919 RepID=UPI003AF4B95B